MKTMNKDFDVKAAWIAFKADPENNQVIKNQLIEHYGYIVERVAMKLRARLPDSVDYEDLVSSGNFGLMDAIDKFDLARCIKFDTFSPLRIRGAMLDEIRNMDWVPRLVRSRAQKLGTARRLLTTSLGRAPTSEEMADFLKIDLAELQKIQKDGSAVGVVSLSRKYFETDSNKDVREIDILEDNRAVNPAAKMTVSSFWESLLSGFNRAERLIMKLYYQEDMTMKEIGAVVDLSESRVSQLHSSMLLRLKARVMDRTQSFDLVIRPMGSLLAA